MHVSVFAQTTLNILSITSELQSYCEGKGPCRDVPRASVGLLLRSIWTSEGHFEIPAYKYSLASQILYAIEVYSSILNSFKLGDPLAMK
jgi:hypothetical protein